MLPSSYVRRLRTQDLIQRNFPDINLQQKKSSSRSFTNHKVEFIPKKSPHAYYPYLQRERTRTYHCSKVSGLINLVLEHLSEIDKKEKDEEDIFKKKVSAIFIKEKRDTPVPPPLKVERQRSKVSKQGNLQPIKERRENVKKVVKPVKLPEIEKDTPENLTKERMVALARTILKDKRMATNYRRNPNRIEIMPPIICEGTPAWSQEVKSETVILVPIKSLRFVKWKYTVPYVGYIEVNLPRKNPRARLDTYAPLRADDEQHVSTSKLNIALVEVFLEGLRVTKFGDYSLLPKLNFDYLNDTLEFVFTKHLRIPLIPALFISADDPLYVIKPNLPDIDPTSDTLFRACYLIQEENIIQKISTTDQGLRFDALKVIHTLCKQDWRLQSLSVYQLKNVLMHDIDFEIDHSPRWQRLTRDVCVQAILKRLLYFVKKGKLPHFFHSDFDLFQCIPRKTLGFMHTPLERLVSNEPQLLRDLQRASRTNEDSDTSSESDEDWW
ncbi:positive regulation of mitochondrial fission [Mactra antiquata]